MRSYEGKGSGFQIKRMSAHIQMNDARSCTKNWIEKVYETFKDGQPLLLGGIHLFGGLRVNHHKNFDRKKSWSELIWWIIWSVNSSVGITRIDKKNCWIGIVRENTQKNWKDDLWEQIACEYVQSGVISAVRFGNKRNKHPFTFTTWSESVGHLFCPSLPLEI